MGGLSETGNKATSASIEIEVEFSRVELRLSLATMNNISLECLNKASVITKFLNLNLVKKH